MLKNKKIVLIIIIVLICIIAAIITLLFLGKKKKENIVQDNLSTSIINVQEISEEEAQKNFLKMFSDVNYSEEEDSQEIVSTVFKYEKVEENKYDVDVHFPKINLDTCEDINNEIIKIFGTKLMDIVKNEVSFTKYSVDYVWFSNNGIISLIIKSVLSEGNNAQRVIISTYNYNVNKEEIISLEEIIEDNNFNKEKIQEKINNTIRSKNSNVAELVEQGYNIYSRDINSPKYNIENIENYFLDENGNLYIVFAYGNNNYTETMDIIQINN